MLCCACMQHLLAQSYYYTLDGERVDAKITEKSLSSFRVDDGSKKGVIIKSDQVENFVMQGDSMTLLKDVDIGSGPKSFYAKVEISGTIGFYSTYYRNSSDETRYVYVLKKGDHYENIGLGKKWKELFNDNTDIYNQIKELKPKDYYYSQEKLIELIKQYNESSK